MLLVNILTNVTKEKVGVKHMELWKSIRIASGVALIAAAVFTGFNVVWAAIVSLLVCGGLDIALAVKKDEQTLSQFIHKQFNNVIDVGIMIGLLIFTWLVFGPASFLPVMLGVIAGHLFWHED